LGVVKDARLGLAKLEVFKKKFVKKSTLDRILTTPNFFPE